MNFPSQSFWEDKGRAEIVFSLTRPGENLAPGIACQQSSMSPAKKTAREMQCCAVKHAVIYKQRELEALKYCIELNINSHYFCFEHRNE